MQLGYILRESFSGFRRAKLSFTAAVVTITLSLLLMSLFFIAFINLNTLIDSIRSRVELEVMLSDSLPADSLASLQSAIKAMDAVGEVTYVSKEQAAKIFQKEFGEDIYKVLDFNPLPASLKVRLKEQMNTSADAARISRVITSMYGVEDIVYRKALLEIIDKRARIFTTFSLIVGALITLAAMMLVANTIRLAIYTKRNIISTMRLIGATPLFVRTPFIIEGVFQGFIGGIFAASLVFGSLTLLRRYFSADIRLMMAVEPYYYAVIIGAGCLLGFFGSLIAIRRFLRVLPSEL